MFNTFQNQIKSHEHVALMEGKVPSKIEELKCVHYLSEVTRKAVKSKDGTWKWDFQDLESPIINFELVELQLECVDIKNLSPLDSECKIIPITIFCNNPDYNRQPSVMFLVNEMFKNIGGYVDADDCGMSRKGNEITFTTRGWSVTHLCYRETEQGYQKIYLEQYSANGRGERLIQHFSDLEYMTLEAMLEDVRTTSS